MCLEGVMRKSRYDDDSSLAFSFYAYHRERLERRKELIQKIFPLCLSNLSRCKMKIKKALTARGGQGLIRTGV